MTKNTQTNTIAIESVLEAAGIPRHASIYDIEWTEEGDLEVEWAVDE